MRLICVPLWLTQTLKYNGLTESALMSESTLSPYLSKQDLVCYTELGPEMNEHLMKTYGLQDELTYPDSHSFYIGKPFELSNPEVKPINNVGRLLVEQIQGTKGLDQAMVGRHLPSGYFWSMTARPLNSTQGDGAIGLFVYLIEGTLEDKTKADAEFLSELLELLYAHNLTTDTLAQSGLLGAYINRLT